MKKSILISLVCLYANVFAVEGYKDIYVQNNKDIYLHTIYCAKDLSNINALRPSLVYTNTGNIIDGTYYFKSAFGDFSQTFKQVDGQDSSIKIRGTLGNGETSKDKMKKEVCLVSKYSKLPKALNKKIKRDVLKSNDPQWNKKMKQYTNYFGKPASSKGKYISQK